MKHSKKTENVNLNIKMECEEITVPPDGGWGWMVLIGTIIMNVVLIGHCKSFGMYFKILMHKFDASPRRIAWLQSLQLFIFGFLSPFSSILSQVTSPRKLGVIGSLIAFASLIISALVPSLEYLYVSFGIGLGIAITFTFTAGITVIAEYFHSYRGLANGLMMAGNALGGIIMPLFIQFLNLEYTLEGCFLIMGSLSLSSCVGAMLWQPVKWHLRKIDKKFEATNLEKQRLYDFSSTDVNINESDISKEEIIPAENNLLRPLDDVHRFSFTSSKLNIPKIMVDCKFNDKYASGPNLYPSENHLRIPNNEISRGGSHPHLSNSIKSRDSHSSGRNSITKIFHLDPSKKHSSKSSSFLYLSSYSFGPTPEIFLKKEHFDISQGTVPKAVLNDSTTPLKHNQWRIIKCFQMFSLDINMFKKSRFYFMTISLSFHALGYQGTNLILPYRASVLGLTESHIALVLSISALTDLAGRIFCALLSDFHLCPRQYLFIGGMFLSSVMAFSLPFCESYTELMLVTGSFGFCCGSYIGLVVALFADAYSAEQVALVYSISVVIGSFITLGGGPFMCYVLESTGSYKICQSILGLAQLAGAVIWLAEPWASTFEKRAQNLKEKKIEN